MLADVCPSDDCCATVREKGALISSSCAFDPFFYFRFLCLRCVTFVRRVSRLRFCLTSLSGAISYMALLNCFSGQAFF